MRTTPEEYAQLLANQKRVSHKQVKLDHVPSIQEVLALQLTERGVEIHTEYPFHPRRKYKADIAIGNPVWLLVEVDGSGRGGHPGAHRSLQGYEQNRERDWTALMLGLTTLRVSTRQVMSGKALLWILQLIEKIGGKER